MLVPSSMVVLWCGEGLCVHVSYSHHHNTISNFLSLSAALSPKVFTELDLEELESKWTEEANLHPQDDDPATMGAGGGGGGGTLPNLSSGTANLDLFYNAASQEEGHDGHVGGGMVAMEAAKTVADGGACGGGGMMMMQQ